jgi:tetrahydromethanopterin S-methyltransferase subunit B
MGKDVGALKDLRRINPDIQYVGHIPPPLHLQVTSHADIGVVTYTYRDMNNAFCAPNKIWEYAGFGLPVLVSDNPPLVSLVREYEAGVYSKWGRDAIVASLRKIVENYEEMSRGSKRLYESVSLDDVFAEIIGSAEAREKAGDTGPGKMTARV